MEKGKCGTGLTPSLYLFKWNAFALASLQNRDAPLTLPFSSSYGITGEHLDWINKTQPIHFEDIAKSIQFNTSLYFEPDEEIEDYMKKTQDDIREQGDEYKDWVPSCDGRGRYPIGYIYLTVSIDLNRYDRGDYRHDLICFEFIAATTDMSLLFAKSTSI